LSTANEALDLPADAVPEEDEQETVAKRTLSPLLIVALLITTGFAMAFRIGVTSNGPAIQALGLALGLAATYAALAEPRRLPVLLIAYIPYAARYPVGLGGSTSLNLTNVLMLVCLAAVLRSRQPRRSFGGFEYLLLVFLVFGFLAFTTALEGRHWQEPVAEAFRFKRWLTPFLLFFLVRRLAESREDLEDILTTVLWTSTLVGALTWWQGRENGGSSIDKSRIGAVLGQANAMAAFLVYYSLPAFAMFLRGPGRARRLFCLAEGLVMVRGMLYCFSRGAYLSEVAGGCVMMLFKSPRQLVIGLFAAYLTIVYVPALVPGSVVKRIGLEKYTAQSSSDAKITDNLDKSSQHRLMLWDAGGSMIRDHRWLGVGLGRFDEVVDAYIDEPMRPDDPRDAHNAYVKVAAEMGIPAACMMVLLLCSVLALGLSRYFRCEHPFDRALALGLIGSVIGLIVSCLFGSRFSDDSLMGQFWMLVGSVRVLGQVDDDGAADEEADEELQGEPLLEEPA